MGLAFIRSTARKPHIKQWSYAYQSAADDLFAGLSAAVGRVLLAVPRPGSAVCEGEPIHLRLIDERVLAYKGVVPVADLERPSPDVLEALVQCYGILDGSIKEVNELAGTLSIEVGKKGATG
jgi:hypothetical protein